MRKAVLAILFTVMVFAAGICCAQASDSLYPDYSTGTVTGGSGLNVRSGAGTSYDVIGTLTDGTVITLREKVESATGATWYKVIYKCKTGYVYGEGLKISPVCSWVRYTPVKYGKVTASSLNVRSGPGTSYSKLGSYSYGDRMTVKGYAKKDGLLWYRVTYKGKAGYIRASHVKFVSSLYEQSSVTGSDVAAYALKFTGTPYVWGGTSLTSGVDCSGFTMRVYAHFGKTLPHYSYSQENYGKKVSYSSAKPGDLICYGSHVGIYIGNGKIVHASSSAGKVTTGSATYRTIKCVRRIIS